MSWSFQGAPKVTLSFILQTGNWLAQSENLLAQLKNRSDQLENRLDHFFNFWRIRGRKSGFSKTVLDMTGIVYQHTFFSNI